MVAVNYGEPMVWQSSRLTCLRSALSSSGAAKSSGTAGRVASRIPYERMQTAEGHRQFLAFPLPAQVTHETRDRPSHDSKGARRLEMVNARVSDITNGPRAHMKAQLPQVARDSRKDQPSLAT